MLGLILAVMSLFAQAFAGAWTCHEQGTNVPWSISTAPGSAWTIVRWGSQTDAGGGIAFVGYVEPNQQWIYEDFHYDGSYATNTSSGPKDSVWTWAGTYYNGQAVMHGVVTWKLTGPTRIDRTFASVSNGKTTPSGADYCTKLIP